MHTKLPDTALDQLFRTARSYNGYFDTPVSTAQLEAIWDLLKMAPTSANSLPLRITWCVSADSKAKLAACAMPSNQPKILNAPVTAILGMDMSFHAHLPEFFPHADMQSMFANNAALAATTALRNSSMQGGYFILAARAMGLDTGPLSGFDNTAVDEAFFAGSTIKSNFISTLGYGDPATIFGRLPRPGFARFNHIL
jgi:3-hydroxypropanoate dehydrogenase